MAAISSIRQGPSSIRGAKFKKTTKMMGYRMEMMTTRNIFIKIWGKTISMLKS